MRSEKKYLTMSSEVPVSILSRLNRGSACIVLIFTLLGVGNTSLAANRYIRAGANGLKNGNSWTDAWPNFASVTWTRGDKYFVAGGVYNENLTVTKTLSGSTWIIVKKANAADNSLDPGWSPAYASTQAIINGNLNLWDGYVEFDGVTGHGETGHGFKVYKSTVSSSVVSLGNSEGPFHLYHTEIKGAGYVAPSSQDGVSNNNVVSPKKGLHIANCWIHEVSRNGITIGGLIGTSYSDFGLLFEKNVLSETGGVTNGDHGQGMQISYGCGDAFTIIRNNEFRNISGTGMIVWLAGSGSIHREARIYNNVFRITNLAIYNTVSPGVIYAHDLATSTSGISIYNNIFYGIGSPSYPNARGNVVLDTTGASNNTLVNNIWENSYLPGAHRGVASQANNGYFGNSDGRAPTGTMNQINGNASAFVDANSNNFQLTSGSYAIGNGVNLTNIFNDDFSGKTRGSLWDLGAFQIGTNNSTTVPPSNAVVQVIQQ